MEPPIRTKRLLLAPLTAADASVMHAIWTSAGVRRFLFDDEILSFDRACELIRESERLWHEERCGLWGVRVADEGALIGFAGFWYFRDPPERELLYGIAEEQWGRGLATEAARAILDYGFESLGFAECMGSTDWENIASRRVMEKLGMRFDRRVVVEGLDTAFYRLTRHQWTSLKDDN